MQKWYVIASNEEKYLWLSYLEVKPGGEIEFDWIDNILIAYASDSYEETEKFAKDYFKNNNNWYIKSYTI